MKRGEPAVKVEFKPEGTGMRLIPLPACRRGAIVEELYKQTKENAMLIRTHIGVSLDGFVATPDGLPAWDIMPTFGPGSHGIAELMEQCDAVVMGRTSFDQGFQDWLANWPWPGKQIYVLTSRPLPANAPAAGVIASKGGPTGLLEQLRAARLARDVQLLGGPRIIQAFLALGAIDRLGMVVLPVLLGKGIPLFAIEITTFSKEAWAASQASPSGAASRSLLRLDRQRAFPDGAVELVYRRET
jgi:dihydrofolate reductase